MSGTASAGLCHRLCRGVAHPPQSEQLRRLRTLPARRRRRGARLRLRPLRLQPGDAALRGPGAGGRQGGQRRAGIDYGVGASVPFRPAARHAARKTNPRLLLFRLSRQRGAAHERPGARHPGFADAPHARRARQRARRTAGCHSGRLHRIGAQLLPALLQPPVPEPRDGELRHSGPLQPAARRLLRAAAPAEARTAHRAVLRRPALLVAQLLRRRRQENDGRHGQQPHPPVRDSACQERTFGRRERRAGSRPPRVRVSAALQPHVPATGGHHPSEYGRRRQW